MFRWMVRGMQHHPRNAPNPQTPDFRRHPLLVRELCQEGARIVWDHISVSDVLKCGVIGGNVT